MLRQRTPSISLLRYLRHRVESTASHQSGMVTHPKQMHYCQPRVQCIRQITTRTRPQGSPTSSCLLRLLASSSRKRPKSSSLQIRSASSRPPRSNWPASQPVGLWSRLVSHFQRYGSRQPDRSSYDRGMPSLPSFLDEKGQSYARSKPAKPGSELKLRCTEIDEAGNVITVNGEFKKSELIAKYGLLPRDLRKIDSSLLPHILVRPSAILINLLHLRVLIQHNRVLVLDVYGSTDSFAQSQFMYDLSGKLSQKVDTRQAGSLPYEFRALEAVLVSVTQGLETEFEGVSEPVVRVLRELEEDIDRDKLRHLLVWSKKLGTFEQRARLVRDAIEDVLEADDDLATMYQTERAQGHVRTEDNHTEVEMLLESYHKVCDEIVQVSGNLVSNIRNTEEIVKAILDANRNSLMLLDLKFSIGTLGIGSGAFVASLYGMNLKNFIEESDLGFAGVSGGSFAMAVVVCIYGLKKLRKVQRVSMWGDADGCGRIAGMPGATGNGTQGHYYQYNHHPSVARPPAAGWQEAVAGGFNQKGGARAVGEKTAPQQGKKGGGKAGKRAPSGDVSAEVPNGRPAVD